MLGNLWLVYMDDRAFITCILIYYENIKLGKLQNIQAF